MWLSIEHIDKRLYLESHFHALRSNPAWSCQVRLLEAVLESRLSIDWSLVWWEVMGNASVSWPCPCKVTECRKQMNGKWPVQFPWCQWELVDHTHAAYTSVQVNKTHMSKCHVRVTGLLSHTPPLMLLRYTSLTHAPFNLYLQLVLLHYSAILHLYEVKARQTL